MSDEAAAAKEHGTWKPKSNPWLIAVVVTLSAFMEVLDTTIVNVSLPHIAGTMSASNDDATWALTSYLIANGIVLTISGWFARLLGRKRYFLICIGMFTVCSLLCGLSNSLAQLIFFRLAQGFFGGGLQPNQQSIILDTFPPDQRGRAFALTALATIVAPVLGPTLGGWITDNFSWRWIFFINIPVGAFAFFAITHLIEDPPWARRKEHAGIDGIGLALIILGLASLQITLDRGEDDGWFDSNFIRLTASMAAAGIAGAIAWLLYAKKPVLNIRVLKDANFALCCVLMFCMASILYASAVVIPLMAQQDLGYNATYAGLLLSPGAFFLIFLIPIVVRLQKTVPTKYIITTGFACLGSAMLYSHGLTPDIDFTTLASMRIAQAGGLAFLFAPLATTAFANISREDNGDAAALFTMFRNVAGSVGISLSTAMITEGTQRRMSYLVSHLTPLDQGYALTLQHYQQALLSRGLTAAAAAQAALGLMYQTLRQQASILAYVDVFGFCAVMAFCVVPVTFFLSRKKGGAPGAAAH